MMNNWTIGKKLFTSTGAIIGLLLALGGTALFSLNTLGTHLNSVVTINAQRLHIAGAINTLTSDMLASERGIMTAAMRNDQVAVRSRHDETKTMFDRLRGLEKDYERLSNTESSKTLLREIEKELSVIEPANAQMLQLVEAGKVEDANLYMAQSLTPALTAVNTIGEKLAQEEIKNMAAVGADASASVNQATWFTAAVAIVALLVGVFVIVVTRGINKKLRESTAALRSGSEQVLAAAGQVSTSSQDLSKASTEQAASIEETSASMEEMSSMTRKNAEHTHAAARLMADVEHRVDESTRSLGDMVSSMAAIQESSQKVSKIIKTIDEIAFQTNILALNAAVEAARAGDAGMGFAVVADEVRNLAQRSAQAAKDTASLIEESIQRAQGGSAKVEQVAGSISGIAESITKVKQLSDSVNEASTQQSQGIGQVAGAISQMEKVTQGIAATAEESAAASEELHAQAETTMGVVAELERMVGGTGLSVSGSTARRSTVTSATQKVAVFAPRPTQKPADSSSGDAPPLDKTGTFGSF